MKKFNIPLIPVITGSAAVVAIIAVIIILTSSGSDAGLYVSEAVGGVSITNAANDSTSSSPGVYLQKGDIITVGDNASCTITYKIKKNSENNYIVVGSNTQLVITDEFTGKKSGEIYLNRGSLLLNQQEEAKANIMVRTADSLIYPEGTVSKVAYVTDGFTSYTDTYSFMGNVSIQLYDTLGNTVNGTELLIEKRSGRITTNDLGPVFSYLNVEFPLNELTASDLKRLIAIDTLIEDFPYTNEELKAAYDSAEDLEPVETEQTSETTLSGDNSDLIQTAEPIETDTSPVVVEPPSQTTKPKQPQTPPPQITTTKKPTTSPESPSLEDDDTPGAGGIDDDDNNTSTTAEICIVVVVVDGKETSQEVAYGANATQPADPTVTGKKFVGWDRSFANIIGDTVITAIFENSTNVYHTVTLVVAGKSTTMQVAHGQAAAIPATITVDGYKFKGWDTNFSYVTSDITVTAILEVETSSVNVTFMVEGLPYVVTLQRGGTAMAPITPTVDSFGRAFTGWDKALTNITTDTTITAVFGELYYTVTFVVDGVSYPTTVKNNENAVPPFTPTVSSQGGSFLYWDTSYILVKSDLTVTAVFTY